MGAVIEAQTVTGYEPVIIRTVREKVIIGTSGTTAAVSACSTKMVTISDTTPEGYTFAGFQSASMSAVTQSSRLRPYYPSNALTEKVVGFYNDQISNSTTYNAKPTARDGSNYYVVVEATLVYLRSDLAA